MSALLFSQEAQGVIEDGADLGFLVLYGLVGDVFAFGEDGAEVGEGEDCPFEQGVVAFAEGGDGGLVFFDHQFEVEVVFLQFFDGAERVGLGALQG